MVDADDGEVGVELPAQNLTALKDFGPMRPQASVSKTRIHRLCDEEGLRPVPSQSHEVVHVLGVQDVV